MFTFFITKIYFIWGLLSTFISMNTVDAFLFSLHNNSAKTYLCQFVVSGTCRHRQKMVEACRIGGSLIIVGAAVGSHAIAAVSI